MSTSASQITIEHCNNAAVIRLQGELDYLFLNDLTHALQNIPKGEHVVLSLESATYLDSIVLHSIVETAGKFKQNRRQLVLISPRSETLQRVLSLTGVELRIRSFADEPTALASFSAPPEGPWDGVDRRRRPTI